ncbi:MAG: trypsin-like peptidase domain-containing protein [Armatimonadota bacterium]
MKRFIEYFVVFILGFIVCAGVLYRWYGPPTAGPVSAPNIPRGGPAVINGGSNSVSKAAAVVSDYVVNIDTVGKPTVQFNPFDFFGGMPEKVVPKGQGSGVIFSSDGYIVTNNHVAAGAEQMKVTLHNGKQYSARLIGRDPASDIAVVKIDAHGLKYARFSNSDTLKVGDWAIAVGSPLGYESTVTVGVVSALRRGPFNINGQTLQLEKLIQTDAAINPGNSGGALADINGNLIGINTMIASTSGGSIGIGFAIPSNTAKNVAEKLIKSGKVDHPYLGVMYGPFDSDRRKQLEQGGISGLPKADGAEIRGVRPGSPAEQAGLQVGDIILKVNGKAISNSSHVESGKTSVSNEVLRSKIGQSIKLQIWRRADGKIVDVTVRLGKMPADYGTQPQQ